MMHPELSAKRVQSDTLRGDRLYSVANYPVVLTQSPTQGRRERRCLLIHAEFEVGAVLSRPIRKCSQQNVKEYRLKGTPLSLRRSANIALRP